MQLSHLYWMYCLRKPTELLRNSDFTMAASSLTIGEGEAEGQHFMKVPLDMV